MIGMVKIFEVVCLVFLACDGMIWNPTIGRISIANRIAKIESVLGVSLLRQCVISVCKFRVILLNNCRCNQHSVLDVSVYDNTTIAVLLQEEAGDNVPVLALLALNTIPEDKYVEVPTEKL